MYTYQCNTIRVIDGNTVDAVNVDDVRSTDETMRTNAVNSKNKLSELLGNEFVCETILNKRGKAGRIMGKLSKINPDGSKADINKQLINLGFAEQFGE